MGAAPDGAFVGGVSAPSLTVDRFAGLLPFRADMTVPETSVIHTIFCIDARNVAFEALTDWHAWPILAQVVMIASCTGVHPHAHCGAMLSSAAQNETIHGHTSSWTHRTHAGC